MLILFPSQPFSPATTDSEFEAERAAAMEAGFGTMLYDHEAVESGDAESALRKVPDHGGAGSAEVMLRGWMIPGERYGQLYAALQAKGYQPQTAPEGYEEAHYLSLAYRHIEGHTPRSAWIEGDDADAAWALYEAGFSTADAIIKDWVKSAKAKWKDGCFIPAGTAEARFREIYGVFRAERGKLFNRGVVLREFMPIVVKGHDVRGIPVVEETRLFFWRGEILVEPLGEPPSPLDERERWEGLARKYSSPFISMDVALLTDGRWIIVEVGDGGVSGLPVTMEAGVFYGRLGECTIFKSI